MSHSDERIAALEAQLATLESKVTENGSRPAAALDRRAMLRRGGAVLAGAAGVMALPGMVSGASAASGGTLMLGAANDAQGNQTSLTSANTSDLATLVVTGTHETNVNSVAAAGSTAATPASSYGQSQLNLTPAVAYTDGGTGSTKGLVVGPFSPNPATSKTGDLFASTATTSGDTAIASDLVYTHSGQFTAANTAGNQQTYASVLGAVYTSAFHNVFVPIADQNTSATTTLPVARVLDTRQASPAQQTIVTPGTANSGTGATTSVNLASSQNSKVNANQVIRVTFTPGASGSLLTAGGALYAVACNLTVANGAQTTGGQGYISAVATAKASDVSSSDPTATTGNPRTANLLVPTSTAASNFAIVPCGALHNAAGQVTSYFFDIVMKFANAIVICDVFGLFVSDTTDVVLSAQPGYTGSSSTAKVQRARVSG